jgi:hypothetical protein
MMIALKEGEKVMVGRCVEFTLDTIIGEIAVVRVVAPSACVSNSFGQIEIRRECDPETIGVPELPIVALCG